jgi:hypothetical protein
MTAVVAALMLCGLAVMYRKKAPLSLETGSFLLALFFLVSLRAARSQIITERMPALFVAWASLAAVYGWFDFVDRFRSPEVQRALTVMGAVLLLGTYGFRGNNEIQRITDSYAPEAQLAEQLGALPESEIVVILPRRIPNILNESSIGAVFANNLALDRKDDRWCYQGRSEGCFRVAPGRVAFWSKESYVIETASEEVRGAFSAGPPVNWERLEKSLWQME